MRALIVVLAIGLTSFTPTEGNAQAVKCPTIADSRTQKVYKRKARDFKCFKNIKSANKKGYIEDSYLQSVWNTGSGNTTSGYIYLQKAKYRYGFGVKGDSTIKLLIRRTSDDHILTMLEATDPDGIPITSGAGWFVANHNFNAEPIYIQVITSGEWFYILE